MILDVVLPTDSGIELYGERVARDSPRCEGVLFVSGGSMTPDVAKFMLAVPCRRRPTGAGILTILALVFTACEQPPDASEPFSDAAVAALGAFDDEDPTVIVRALEQLEVEIAAELDLDGDVTVRSLTPGELVVDDVAALVRPDRDPGLTVPVALAWRSPFTPGAHDPIALLAAQVGVEPYALAYTRTFLDGQDCYPDSCEFLRTENTITKKNIAMTVSFTLFKDWRDLELEDGRAARASRGWMKAGADAEAGGERIEQSYAIELWFEEPGDTTLRLLVLWAETTFDPPEDEEIVALSTRIGMNDLFVSHDAWIGG